MGFYGDGKDGKVRFEVGEDWSKGFDEMKVGCCC